MAFTVYIFKEDGETLRTVPSNARTGASLFGQWTSTGNPVVHFVARNPTEENRGSHLYENYRLCHIGEWRPANSSEDDPYARRSLLSKYRRQGRQADTPARFLVLDVNYRGITPYLFSKPELREERGKVEYLEGNNPFASQRQHPHTMTRNQPSYQQHAASQLQPSRGHAPLQSQTAEVKTHQWYSNEEGKRTLSWIYNTFQSISQRHQVQMTRNTESHDMSMSFTDERRLKKWEVRFPHDFPHQGAILIENSYSLITHREEPREKRQPDRLEVEKAVVRMVRQIQGESTGH